MDGRRNDGRKQLAYPGHRYTGCSPGSRLDRQGVQKIVPGPKLSIPHLTLEGKIMLIKFSTEKSLTKGVEKYPNLAK